MQNLASTSALTARVIFSSIPPVLGKPTGSPVPWGLMKMTLVSLELRLYMVMPPLPVPPQGWYSHTTGAGFLPS